MSRHIITAGPKHDPLSELDIDELVERLTPGKLHRFTTLDATDSANTPTANWSTQATLTRFHDRVGAYFDSALNEHILEH